MLPRQMMKTIGLAVAMPLLLVACGSDNTPEITVRGHLVLTGERTVPDQASARISIVEHRDKGGDERIVAERTLHNIATQPIAFELAVARNLLVAEGDYGLRAELAGADGRVLADVRKARTIEPAKQADVGRIELRPIAQDTNIDFNEYRCEDGFQMAAATNSERAIVRLGNRRLDLAIERDGSGYADDHGNTLTHGDVGIAVRVDGGDHRQCALVEESEKPTSNAPQAVGMTQQRENDAQGEAQANDTAQTTATSENQSRAN